MVGRKNQTGRNRGATRAQAPAAGRAWGGPQANRFQALDTSTQIINDTSNNELQGSERGRQPTQINSSTVQRGQPSFNGRGTRARGRAFRSSSTRAATEIGQPRRATAQDGMGQGDRATSQAPVQQQRGRPQAVSTAESIAMRTQQRPIPVFNPAADSRKTFRPDDRELYLTAPPANSRLLSMVYLLPGTDLGCGINISTAIGREALAQLRKACKVWMSEPIEPLTFLRVWAVSKADLLAGLAALRELSERDDPEPMSVCIANPSTVTIDEKKSIIQREIGSRGVVSTHQDANTHSTSNTQRNVGTQRASSTIRQVVTQPENVMRQEMGKKWRGVVEETRGPSPGTTKRDALCEEFRTTFTAVAKDIKRIPNGMKMNAHLGVLTTSSRSTSRITLSFEDFASQLKMMNTRGTLTLDQRIGDDVRAAQIRDIICGPQDTFECFGGEVLDLRDTKPTYSLAIFAQGLRLELDIGLHAGDPPILRTPVVFRQDAGIKHEITIACPETKFDWRLQVQTQVNTVDIPDNLHIFLDTLKVMQPPVGADFPIPQFSQSLAQAAGVQSISGKVKWTYSMVKSSYLFHLSVFHEWAGLDMMGAKMKRCGASLTNARWDEALRGGKDHMAHRDFGPDFQELFPIDCEGETGIGQFLRHMDDLQVFVCRDSLAEPVSLLD